MSIYDKFLYAIDFGDFTKIGASNNTGKRFSDLHKKYSENMGHLPITGLWVSSIKGDNWRIVEICALKICATIFHDGPFPESFQMGIDDAKAILEYSILKKGLRKNTFLDPVIFNRWGTAMANKKFPQYAHIQG